MKSLIVTIGFGIVGNVILLAQTPEDIEVARLLANDATRQRGIARIVEGGTRMVPRLLAWTQNPPTQVDQQQLFIGLADAFGRLKTKEAIPFLIDNITIQRWLEVNYWLKTGKIIEERLPAAGALVRIGPDASKLLISRYQTLSTEEDRLTAIFVVARIGDPESRSFLSVVLGHANLERYWAAEGLKRIDGRQ